MDNLVQLIGVMDKHLLDTANLNLAAASVSLVIVLPRCTAFIQCTLYMYMYVLVLVVLEVSENHSTLSVVDLLPKLLN